MSTTLSPLVIPAPEPGSGFFLLGAEGSTTPDQVRGDGYLCAAMAIQLEGGAE